MDWIVKKKELYVRDDSLFCEYYDEDERKWVKGQRVTYEARPFVILMTNNYDEKELRRVLRTNPKAKLVKSWKRGDIIDDPYGRPYMVGSIDCEIWDLRAFFGFTDPLETFMNYEEQMYYKQ